MKEEIEEWRVIKDFPNYMVSSLGRVKSLDRYVKHNCGGLKLCKGKIMKPSTGHNGYLRVTLSKNGKTKTFLIHRLVAEAFLQNPNNLPFINHKNEIKSDNFVGTPENNFTDGNLEWITHKQNINYGTRNKRSSQAQLNRIDCSKPVLQYTLYGEFVKEWPSTKEVERELGFYNSHIGKCCNGQLKTAYGYIWRYKEKGVA